MSETIDSETGEVTSTEIIIRNANPWTRVRVAKHFPLPSLAKQSFKEECNINNIMEKYQKTGLLDHLNTHEGNYGNFIGYEEYHQSLNKILEAKEAFATIPSTIRSKFNNDPADFLKFAQNPENLDQMVEMGLAVRVPRDNPPGGGPEIPGETPETASTTPAEAAAAVEAASTP